ncbi:hypothetical protein GCG54_00011670 [Colletotrichum gloeosporioides]|uniref:Uncharacterized protein n=1 Tax=Colletotrichum gloeosporioides TaxID=474922 RepID=A0A8H4CH99_COLGL|nr:uncharacterized protein GCG54_00011670 [Colletotrichum gloeosporioides]KAF3803831.1 hypothetical protein GCG54_00011670 [Colletotrichum gloeosporioides]
MGLIPETFNHPYLLNNTWLSVDIAEERGATRMYPGSHNKHVALSAFNQVLPPPRQRAHVSSWTVVPGSLPASTHSIRRDKLLSPLPVVCLHFTKKCPTSCISKPRRTYPINIYDFWACAYLRERASGYKCTLSLNTLEPVLRGRKHRMIMDREFHSHNSSP